jgi:hypothetical protein
MIPKRGLMAVTVIQDCRRGIAPRRLERSSGIMNVRCAILALLALLVFAGCASTPNEEKSLPVQDLPVGTFGK